MEAFFAGKKNPKQVQDTQNTVKCKSLSLHFEFQKVTKLKKIKSNDVNIC